MASLQLSRSQHQLQLSFSLDRQLTANLLRQLQLSLSLNPQFAANLQQQLQLLSSLNPQLTADLLRQLQLSLKLDSQLTANLLDLLQLLLSLNPQLTANLLHLLQVSLSLNSQLTANFLHQLQVSLSLDPQLTANLHQLELSSSLNPQLRPNFRHQLQLLSSSNPQLTANLLRQLQLSLSLDPQLTADLLHQLQRLLSLDPQLTADLLNQLQLLVSLNSQLTANLLHQLKLSSSLDPQFTAKFLHQFQLSLSLNSDRTLIRRSSEAVLPSQVRHGRVWVNQPQPLKYVKLPFGAGYQTPQRPNSTTTTRENRAFTQASQASPTTNSPSIEQHLTTVHVRQLRSWTTPVQPTAPSGWPRALKALLEHGKNRQVKDVGSLAEWMVNVMKVSQQRILPPEHIQNYLKELRPEVLDVFYARTLPRLCHLLLDFENVFSTEAEEEKNRWTKGSRNKHKAVLSGTTTDASRSGRAPSSSSVGSIKRGRVTENVEHFNFGGVNVEVESLSFTALQCLLMVAAMFLSVLTNWDEFPLNLVRASVEAQLKGYSKHRSRWFSELKRATPKGANFSFFWDVFRLQSGLEQGASHSAFPAQIGKLECFLRYLNIQLEHVRVIESKKLARYSIEARSVTLSRGVGTVGNLWDKSWWKSQSKELTKPVIRGAGDVFDTAVDHVQRVHTSTDREPVVVIADFAARRIGGAVLRGGCFQEEIQAARCPEMLIATLLCPPLKDNEALMVANARSYVTYSGYASSFRCTGDAHQKELCNILCIDAIPFGKQGWPQASQFTWKATARELGKLYVGLSVLKLNFPKNQIVFATGNWGCGAFCGDPQLKFLLQWVACSLAGVEMLYHPLGRLPSKIDAYIDSILAQHRTVRSIMEGVIWALQSEVLKKDNTLRVLGDNQIGIPSSNA